MAKGNIFENIPTSLPDEVFDTLARSDAVRIERIVSRGHSSPETGWYDQERHEWVIVLRGSASVAFENGSAVELAVGDYLNIPAHARHRVQQTSSHPETIWLAVHYR